MFECQRCGEIYITTCLCWGECFYSIYQLIICVVSFIQSICELNLPVSVRLVMLPELYRRAYCSPEESVSAFITVSEKERTLV